MALKKCSECGEPVSNKAKACPACGAPAKKSSAGSVFLLLVVLFVGYNMLQVSSISTELPRAALTTPVQASVAASTGDTGREEEYFYCGYTNLDGSAQDYSKWGKGTDYTYNDGNSRWERITEYTYQYIYLDGRYEQEARAAFFDDQEGVCNLDMKLIYTQRMNEILQGN